MIVKISSIGNVGVNVVNVVNVYMSLITQSLFILLSSIELCITLTTLTLSTKIKEILQKRTERTLFLKKFKDHIHFFIANISSIGNQGYLIKQALTPLYSNIKEV